MATHPGTFVWYELAAPDQAAATDFYRTVVGWRERDAGMPGFTYMLMLAGEAAVAGIMATPPGARAGWTGYAAVDDVDASAAKVAALGGTVHRAPDDIPGVGRFAVVADPGGNPFALFRGQGEPPAVVADTPGFGGWHELHAADWKAVWPFYEALFGWTPQRTIDMGPMGEYQVFGPPGGDAVGGMMTNAARQGWLYYFNVDGIDDAVARVQGAGGTVVAGPHEVPGGSLIIHAMDPGGVLFALVSRSRNAG